MKTKIQNKESNLQLENIKNDIFLSQKEKDIIVGTILGDAHIKSTNKLLDENFYCALSYGYANKNYAEFVFKNLTMLK